MPTYEYVCEKCDHEFEKFQSMEDKPLATCPADLCGKKKWGKGKVRKLISAGAGLIFKGSGFYITDYRSDKYKAAAKADSAAAPSSGGENKPEKSSSGESKSEPSSGGDSKSGTSSGGESKAAKSEAKSTAKGSKAGST